MDLITFGQRIRQRREELGLSQNEVAMALRLPQGKVSMIEKGTRRIDVINELPALAEVLNVSMNWFYGKEDSKIMPAESELNKALEDMEKVRKALLEDPFTRDYVNTEKCGKCHFLEHKYKALQRKHDKLRALFGIMKNVAKKLDSESQTLFSLLQLIDKEERE